ncbi:MAG: glutathione S-transferase N-terminal domain-containing protein [Paracoccaceae bacterium]|jgi:glutathione S-transferase|nr:glutathione S-transferase N-terminal domain-containing protein [Paracoccaceae bacterium]
MKLIYAGASPFVRKVSVVLNETGLIDSTELIQVATTPVNSAAEAISANPSGKIPALILDDGSTLYDSRVICRYLDAQAGANLYPLDDIWNILTLEATADAIMDAAVLMTYEKRIRPADMGYEPWIEAQWSKIERSIGAITTNWMTYLSGPLTIGQIGVACALNYIDFRHADRDWRGANSDLADWYNEFSQRPAMVATQPS